MLNLRDPNLCRRARNSESATQIVFEPGSSNLSPTVISTRQLANLDPIQTGMSSEWNVSYSEDEEIALTEQAPAKEREALGREGGQREGGIRWAIQVLDAHGF